MRLRLDLGQRLEAFLDLEKGCLRVNEEKTQIEGLRRTLSEMKEVLYDEGAASRRSEVAYRVFRRVALSRDLPSFEASGVRYDLTILPSGNWGGECPKTFGHLHQRSPASCPEVYEVVKGRAHFLMQSIDAKDMEIVEVHEGAKLVIPPDILHLIINPTDHLLVTSNLVADDVSQDYEYIRRMGGAAYYELQGRRFVKNAKYLQEYDLRVIDSSSASFGKDVAIIDSNERIYDLFLEHPEKFRFLTTCLGA